MSASIPACEPGAIGETRKARSVAELAERSEVGELLIRRALGACIDFLVLFLFLLAPDYSLGNTLYRDTLWVWVGAQALYFVIGEGIWGRSLGKLLTGTVVVDGTGRSPGILKAAARTALRIVEVNPLFLCLPAGIAFITSARRQRLGDMLARTYVVRAKDLKRAFPETQVATPVEVIAERSTPFPLLLRRAIGAQIDILLLILILIVVPFSFFGKERLDGVEHWVALFGLAAAIVYFVALEGAWGRTLGKLITGTIVVDGSGRAPGMLKAATRTLLRVVEVDPLLIGGIPAGIALLVTKRHQRVGDLLAGTYVVRRKDLRRNALPVTARHSVAAIALCAGVTVAGLAGTFALVRSTPQPHVSLCGQMTDASCDPKDAVGFGKLGKAYATAGDPDRAIAAYNEAIRFDPRSASAYSDRAIAYHNKGQFDRAIADYSDAIRLAPNFAEAYNNRGLALVAQGDNDLAVADYDKAILLKPENFHFYANRAAAYAAKGELYQAIADFSETIRLDPTNVNALMGRGNVYFGKGRIDLAIVDYDDVIRLDPKSAGAYSNRAVVYLAEGDLDRALADASTAIQLNSKLAIAYTVRGVAYFNDAEFVEAAADFRKASELDPRSAYNALWLDIVEERGSAAGQLSLEVSKIDMTAWPAPIVRMFIGEITPTAAAAAATDISDANKKSDRACDANFFSAEFFLRRSAQDEAIRRFRLAASDCPYASLERSAAKARLKMMDAAQLKP
jgi:tetratricopeptide (TPR) repeat protein